MSGLGLLGDDGCDGHREMVANSAERLEVHAKCIQMFLDIREDDRAQAAREALAKEMGVLNQRFADLGKALSERPSKAARDHFARVGSKEHRQEETNHHRRLDQDAEADADAAATQ